MVSNTAIVSKNIAKLYNKRTLIRHNFSLRFLFLFRLDSLSLGLSKTKESYLNIQKKKKGLTCHNKPIRAELFLC